MIGVDPDGWVEVPTARNLNPERRAQNRLVEGGLMRRIDVAAKQRGGGRRGAREYLYFLSDARKAEAIIATAKLLGVGDPKKAKDNYMRGGSRETTPA